MSRAVTLPAPVYDTRAGCPAHHHDTYSAARKAGCVCPKAVTACRRYTKLQENGYLTSPFVDPAGTRRRVQALATMGWSAREVFRRVGWTGAPGHAMHGNRQIRRETAAAVARVYDELWNRPGPDVRVRAYAQRSGWAPPQAWDDDTIDDPQAQPYREGGEDPVDEVAIALVHAGTLAFGALTKAEQVELFRRYRHTDGRGSLCGRWNISTATFRRLERAAGVGQEQAA